MPALVLMSIDLVLQLALVVVLVGRYLRTRNIGFVWLGVAVVVWPFLSSLLNRGVRALLSQASSGHSVPLFPFNLIQSGRMTAGSLVESFASVRNGIGIALLLVAALYLGKPRRAERV